MLKTAKVTPLFKSADAENDTNYRPISFLPGFSKILERIMCNLIYKHLENNNLLFDKQLWFQLKNSTEHAILNLLMIFLVLLREENIHWGYLLISLKRLIL